MALGLRVDYWEKGGGVMTFFQYVLVYTSPIPCPVIVSASTVPSPRLALVITSIFHCQVTTNTMLYIVFVPTSTNPCLVLVSTCSIPVRSGAEFKELMGVMVYF
jgi:hypothetical protein